MERDKALDMALGQIEKQFGKGSIMRMGDDSPERDIQFVSTGSLGLDIALGLGGLPRGRVVEIYGPESSGKTTLALTAIAEVQRNGGTAAFVDAEHALDPAYAEKLGVNVNDLLVSQPDTGEQALEITDMLVRSGAVDVIVIDSVAALTPKAVIEGEMGEPQMGPQARLMSQALRKLTANIKRTNTLVIFINQIRMKIGVMFGNPETTTGGNALKFYSSVRLDIRRIGGIKKGDEVIGNETRVKVVKNKLAPPFREAHFEILYNEGIYTGAGNINNAASATWVTTNPGGFTAAGTIAPIYGQIVPPFGSPSDFTAGDYKGVQNMAGNFRVFANNTLPAFPPPTGANSLATGNVQWAHMTSSAATATTNPTAAGNAANTAGLWCGKTQISLASGGVPLLHTIRGAGFVLDEHPR